MTATLALTGLDPLLRTIAATAAEIDEGHRAATTHLGALAEAGLLDLGIDDLLAGRPTAADIRPAADTIAAVAEECLPTAFGLWAHRVVEDYLARGHSSTATSATLDRLRKGEVVGSTGMAQALKSLAGLGDLGIEAVPSHDGGWVLTGFVSWISNLVDHAVLVLPARTPDGGGIVAWVTLSQPGLTPHPISGLLALDATASGTLKLDGVQVGADHVLSRDLAGFVRAVKPTFLLLQTAFAAGLIRRSWREIENALDRSENAVFARDARRLGDAITEFLDRWQALAADTASAAVRDVLRVRLDASHLAQQATRLELTLAGGRGYLVASGANRRFREAAFLPVQSPSEGHLTWELSSLA